MKSTIKRSIAVLLTICMLGSILPLQIWAEEAQAAARTVSQGEQPAGLDTPEGEIPVEEDWDEAYPYGTFAFGSYQADVGEPGALTPESEVRVDVTWYYNGEYGGKHIDKITVSSTIQIP